MCMCVTVKKSRQSGSLIASAIRQYSHRSGFHFNQSAADRDEDERDDDRERFLLFFCLSDRFRLRDDFPLSSPWALWPESEAGDAARDRDGCFSFSSNFCKVSRFSFSNFSNSLAASSFSFSSRRFFSARFSSSFAISLRIWSFSNCSASARFIIFSRAIRSFSLSGVCFVGDDWTSVSAGRS